MKKIQYDTNIYNFSESLVKYFFTEENKISLNAIHTVKDESGKILGENEVFTREKDQSTFLHKKFYEFARLEIFSSLYNNFIKNIVRPLYDEPIVYQSIPTFRIHMPLNNAVGEFHKDKQYRDVKWAESVHEDNFFFLLQMHLIQTQFGLNQKKINQILHQWNVNMEKLFSGMVVI